MAGKHRVVLEERGPFLRGESVGVRSAMEFAASVAVPAQSCRAEVCQHFTGVGPCREELFHADSIAARVGHPLSGRNISIARPPVDSPFAFRLFPFS